MTDEEVLARLAALPESVALVRVERKANGGWAPPAWRISITVGDVTITQAAMTLALAWEALRQEMDGVVATFRSVGEG